MWIVKETLDSNKLYASADPSHAYLYALTGITENMLSRFWLAGLGVVSLFGFIGERGLALFLAAELTIFWAVGKIGLFVYRKKAGNPGL
jgi:hypothetical protein